jgi:hypothetical protein
MNSKEQIESEIDLLVHEQSDSRVFWEHVRRINAMFKNVKLPQEERENLWNKLSLHCSQMKAVQQSRREGILAKSTFWFDSIRHDILLSKPNDLFGFDPPDIEEMKALSNKLREAGQELSNHKDEITFQHKQELFQLIQEVRKIQDTWWDDLKKQRDQKQKDFRERIKANLEKNKERLRRQCDALERHETALNNLQEKIDNASEGNWLDRALSEYKPDLETKIDDIKESIKRIEGWIEEDEAKL